MQTVYQPLPPNEWDYGPTLASRHADMLRASLVPPEIALERGYRTIVTPDDVAGLAKFGFKDYQRRPGLLVPIHALGHTRLRYQLRADQPRSRKNGNACKYDTPAGQPAVIDAPQRTQASLEDPAIPLFITEGAKKVDCLLAFGQVAIGLAGVWGFIGTNELGGKIVLPEWRLIALNGRTVHIAFDSDIMTKPQVRRALQELGRLLKNRAADVRYIDLSKAVS